MENGEKRESHAYWDRVEHVKQAATWWIRKYIVEVREGPSEKKEHHGQICLGFRKREREGRQP